MVRSTRILGSALVGVMIACLSVSFASAATIFSSTFENMNFTQWTHVDTGTLGLWKIDTSRYAGRYSARVSGPSGAVDDILMKEVSTLGMKEASFSFWYKASSLDAKSSGEFDQLFAEYSTDGVNWILVKEVNGKSGYELDGSWRFVSAPLPESNTLKVRFRAHFSDDGDRAWVDDVTISALYNENTLEQCTDTLDNDEDGMIDATDSDCAPFIATLTVTKEGDGAHGGTVISGSMGINCGTDCVENYFKGSKVTLYAHTDDGIEFLGWGGVCAGTQVVCNVTMSESKSVIARYRAIPQYNLSVVNIEEGQGNITSNLAGIDCGVDCTEAVYENTYVTLQATAAEGYSFVGWTGICAATAASICEFTMTGDAHAGAQYLARPQFMLTVENSPTSMGSISSAPSGINCGVDCSEVLYENAAVSLTATPTVGNRFVSWGGACALSGTSPVCAVTMTGNMHATAQYEVIPQFTLTVANSPVNMGSVSSIPAGITCGSDCSEVLSENLTITLTASPIVNHRFTGWSGACSGTGSCIVTMNANKHVVANYEVSTHSLIVANNAPGQGVITSASVGINCGTDCTETYYEGTSVSITATPAFGYLFDAWSGDCNGAIQTCNVTMSSAKNATAHYKVRPAGICGNNIPEWNEGCDHGNTVSGDGCSATCQIEPGYTCTQPKIGAPSLCTVPSSCQGTYGCQAFLLGF